MNDILSEICARKRQHIEQQKQKHSLSDLEAMASNVEKPRGFIKAIQTQNASGKPALIAEVKKASPSKGIIREDFDPVEIAKIYEANGATCLSVLTDEPYFQGADAYLQSIKPAVTLPALRKDFMIDPYQITESRSLGADCILLIMAAMEDTQAKELFDTAASYTMDVLIEVHNKEELARAQQLIEATQQPEHAMIGVNNRNLKTLVVDTQTSFDLLKDIPETVVKVAESGLKDAETIHNLHQAGYNAFLIGESLMAHPDIAAKIKLLFPH